MISSVSIKQSDSPLDDRPVSEEEADWPDQIPPITRSGTGMAILPVFDDMDDKDILGQMGHGADVWEWEDESQTQNRTIPYYQPIGTGVNWNDPSIPPISLGPTFEPLPEPQQDEPLAQMVWLRPEPQAIRAIRSLFVEGTGEYIQQEKVDEKQEAKCISRVDETDIRTEESTRPNNPYMQSESLATETQYNSSQTLSPSAMPDVTIPSNPSGALTLVKRVCLRTKTDPLGFNWGVTSPLYDESSYSLALGKNQPLRSNPLLTSKQSKLLLTLDVYCVTDTFAGHIAIRMCVANGKILLIPSLQKQTTLSSCGRFVRCTQDNMTVSIYFLQVNEPATLGFPTSACGAVSGIVDVRVQCLKYEKADWHANSELIYLW